MRSVSESIQQTVREFHSESSQWEDEVLELFNDIDRFLTTERPSGGGEGMSSVAKDVAGLRGVVEQQTEVIAALVNALTGDAKEEAAAKKARRYDDQPMVEVDPFERLQRAVTAAAEMS